MKKLKMLNVVFLGLAGLAAVGALTADALAVTADNVVCNGCVQSTDIANNTVSTLDIKNYTVGSLDLNPGITLGTNTTGGLFTIRTTVSPAARVFEADGRSATRVVRVGQGGTAATNEDTDLQVIDPSFSATSTEPVMHMDASSGTLYLGSGSLATNGQQGELYIDSGTGSTNVWLYGNGSAYLGSSSWPGYLALDDGTSSWLSIQLSGSSGTLFNKFEGNGLVKAWARINADGTVAGCFRCNTNQAETQLLGTGVYEVDFTPLGTDVSGRPWTCSLGNGAAFGAIGQIGCVQRSGDPSSLFVDIRSTAGAASNQAFTVVLY